MTRPAFALLAASAVGAAAAGCSARVASSGQGVSGQGVTVPADGPCVTAAGGVTTIAPAYAYALAFDDASLYAATGGGLVAYPLGGGAATSLTSPAEVDALAVAGGSAYFISSHAVGGPDAQGKTSSTTALYAMPLAGGTPQLLVDDTFAMQVASDGAWVWWTGVGLTGMQLPGGSPISFPLDRGATVNAIVVGDDALYLALQTLRHDLTHFGSIVRASKDGTSVTPIVDGLASGVWSLAVDEGSVYWIDDDGVHRAGLDGTGVTVLSTASARSVAVDAHAVYFTTAIDDTVQEVPKTGGSARVIASGLKSPGTLAIHGGNVYWVDGTSVALSDPDPGYAIMTACK